MLRVALIACLTASPTLACETALLLSVDVSGSISAGDYQFQTEGIALALADPTVAEALVADQVALAVMQWSGIAEQELVMDWQVMRTEADVRDFGARALALPRAFKGSDTAVGQGLRFAIAQFGAAPECRRQVIDISGDGQENTGFSDAEARAEAEVAGITVNALAIEAPGSGLPITSYYLKWVITQDGFVLTARGLISYPETLRLKLLRELVKPVG